MASTKKTLIDTSEQEAKYFLAAIVESSQDSIVTIDLNRIITTWNEAAEHLYGYTAAEVIGKPLELLMLPNDIIGLVEKVEKIANEISVPRYETVRVHKSGKQADLQIALSPVRDSEGTVIGISTIARDITEAKLQEQLKDEFIAVASHELKTPVTSIKGFTELLLQKSIDAGNESAYVLKKLDQQVDRLIILIQTLLDTTKLSGGKLLITAEPFDLSALVEEQIEVIQRLSPNHHIQFEGKINLMVVADRKLIGQAISNFVSNAVKYSPKGGAVIVSLRQTDECATVTVEDFGVGIPDGLDHKIFERYFRVNQMPNSSIPGVGLGLYITAQIVQQHGGKIKVESKEGKGSRFSFDLPLHTTDQFPA
jgi:PAS domain S-box-containing protein